VLNDEQIEMFREGKPITIDPKNSDVIEEI
jgi:hypothetical protein